LNTNSISYIGLDIKHITKPSLKHSYINITQDSEVVIKTPKVSQEYLFKLIQNKESWIKKKLNFIKQNPYIKMNLDDEVLFLGELYSIDSTEVSDLRLNLEKIKVGSTDKSIKCYNKFYRDSCIEYVVPRVEYFSNIMGLEYKEIKFRKMKSRWGSCSSKKTLTFNTELIKIKKELVDYVIVHELAHLKHMNHSKEFHSFVDRYLPNSYSYRQELKKTRIQFL